MSDHLKYIIVMERGLELPILFPAIVDHASVANGFTVVSAGFVSIYGMDDKFQVSCWGESTGLKIKSRPEDSEIIKVELERPHR